MHFEEYYKRLGFTEYPFGVFTSEGEIEKLDLLFLQPSSYTVIAEGLRNTSAIVIGERGTGKTALSLDIGKTLKGPNSLLVRIEEFSSLEENYDTEKLYRFIIEDIAREFFLGLSENPSQIWKYTKDERIDLSMYLHEYLGASSKQQLREKIRKIQNSRLKRYAIDTYNFSRVALNYGLKAATKFLSDALTKHFSALPELDASSSDYFIKIETEVDDTFTQEQKQHKQLTKLCSLIKKSGRKKIYVIIDKIDEDDRFENDAESVGKYIKKMVTNNKILTLDSFHVLMFIWSTPFNNIKNNVRTQKLTFQQITWNKGELITIAEKRLSAYSDQKVYNIEEIFENISEEEKEFIIGMCNNNPRNLWHILDECFKAQFKENPNKKISKSSISIAIENFVRGFNYYEYYPKKSNSRRDSMDVFSYIKHLTKLDSEEFTKNQLNEKAGTGGSTNNYVLSMENMGLIKKTEKKGRNGAVIYRIKDPKICYAMKYGIEVGT